MKTTLTLICTFIFISFIFAQEADKVSQNQLDRIRQNIEEYRQKIQRESQKENQLLDALSELDREIDLRHQLVSELKNEDKKKSNLIVKIGRNLRQKEAELQRLQDIYAKRVVTFYKYGRMKDIELLLDSKSFNQTLTWMKYQRVIARNDQRNYHNILEKKSKIENQKNKIKNEVIEKRKLIKEKSEEENILKKKSEERNSLLAQVQQNKQNFLNKIKEYENSAKEIQRLIRLEENKRLTLEQQGIVLTSDFPSLRGRMVWPTVGRIISHFGRNQHPKWKTVTENIGIDIEGEFGQDVRCVSKGIVTAITWQRGRGNIVIINHNGGYFTVYTHLSNILVQIDETVDAGQVIGNVGDSGSLKGPMLHFEIWQNDKYLNPEEWLS